GTQLQDLYAASSGTRKANPSYGNPKNDNPNYGNPDYGNPDYDNTEDAFSAVFCADLDTPPSEATTAAAARRAAKRSPRVGAFYSWYIPRCPGLDGPSADRYTGPWRPAGAAPALFMTNAYDPITDQAGVDRMARLVPGSRVLTGDGWDHVQLGTRGCGRAESGEYAREGDRRRRTRPRGRRAGYAGARGGRRRVRDRGSGRRPDDRPRGPGPDRVR